MKYHALKIGVFGSCIAIFSVFPLAAQVPKYTLGGTVYESVNGGLKPLRQATVTLRNMGVTVATDAQGRFLFRQVPVGELQLHGQYIGKLPIDTLIRLEGNQEIQLVMKRSDFRLEEVAVTAQQSRRTLATSSVVERAAIDHLQANSLADVMSLMPGARASNPDLSFAKQINIRGIVGESSDLANAFGTSVIVNGAPTSNNANLQVINPVTTGGSATMSGGAAPAGGTDMRNIPVQNIESVEVVRGIPSVEYGDVASGAVIVTQKAGKQPLLVEARTNPNLYAIMANQGIQLPGNKGALNIGADYSHNVTKPEQAYLYYQRSTFHSLYSNQFFQNRLSSNTAFSYSYGKQSRDLNPDDARTFTESYAKENTFTLNTNGTLSFANSGLKHIRYTLNANYAHKDSYLQNLYTNATAPYSMSYSDGAVLSNRPGQHLYDDQGQAITFIPEADRNHYAVYLPSSYIGQFTIDGKELSSFAKVIASFYHKIGATEHKWALGSDFKIDKNYGSGKDFDDELPPVKDNKFVNASFRKRTFHDIPALRQWGIFAQEQLTAALGRHTLQIEAGLRYDLFSGKRSALSPRVNASIDVLPNIVTLRGGYGMLAKAPSIMHLYPEQAYFEYININELASNIPAQEQNFMTTTRVFDTGNADLKIAKNQKAELGVDVKFGKSLLRITGFQEKLRDGYSYSLTNSSFQPVDYIEYKRENVALPIYTGTSNSVLAAFNRPNNSSLSLKKGVELELNLKRIDAIRTQFSFNGMHIWRRSSSSNYTYYDDESGLGASNRTHVGLYAPDMIVSFEKATSTALRATHNIPSIGLVVTLTAETIWNSADWKTYGNDSIPLKYISKEDGLVYDYEEGRKEEPEFKALLRKVNRPYAVVESLPTLFNFNMNITKEIRDFMRVSFFANNLFRSYPMHRSDRVNSNFIGRNDAHPYFFGLNVALKIK